ncbi:MAG: DUF4391 domain-containing protein [Deltaproteobacteria bacterium]|jgi:hypothetical protein|nr:DUF4391 domain-containing protein [Deltaproteobacteria bacterium]
MNKAIEDVLNGISFPEAALLSKRVPKKQFFLNGELVSRDKKLFRNKVKNVYWEYTLKPSTCKVLPFMDNEREYLEVAILLIEMISQKGHKRIAEIIHRMIPYPLMLCFYTETDKFALSIAPKRFSQVEQGAFVVERFFSTKWMDGSDLTPQESSFIESLAWSNMSIQNYATLYKGWVERFTGYECSEMSGNFSVGKAVTRISILKQCRELESKISMLRRQLKKSAFNRQVELNIQIKKNENELKKLIRKL